MERSEAKGYVRYVVDDAGAGRRINDDIHAIVREPGDVCAGKPVQYGSVLVGWEIEGDPLFVAVHSYLDVTITPDEAKEMATDYLIEVGYDPDQVEPKNALVL